VKSIVEKAYNLRPQAKALSMATTPEEAEEMWRIRKECLLSCQGQYPDKKIMITDVCVPLGYLPQLMVMVKSALKDSPLPCPIVAHAGPSAHAPSSVLARR
jgi:FAD/FMN-containing dehydrogenase